LSGDSDGAPDTLNGAATLGGSDGDATENGKRDFAGLLGHAAVPLWLNSGVPATEVARRAGDGVAVLLKIYAHCIDGQADAANKRITDALGTQDAEQDPGDEGDGDSEQAS
jgi:hypothetical protein